jgi:hypothetical protein
MRVAGKFAPGEQEVFDRYYQKYALARWTEPDKAASLASFREELGNDLLSPKTGAVRDHLNALVLDFMKALAAKNYYPAARHNAMLMIGELNAVEPERYGDLPVPLPEALPVLVQALQDPKQMDVVKSAALVGILRHLELDAVKAPDDRAGIRAAALAVVVTPRPPGRSADGHGWLRMRAAEVLGALGEVGAGGAVANALAGMVVEAASPFDTRCSAAEALGRLDYQGAAGLDALKLAAALGRLAVDACAAEAKAQAKAEAKTEAEADAAPQPLPGRGSGPVMQPVGGPEGPFGPQPGVKPPPQIPTAFRNRLKYRVRAASIGLGGTKENPGGVTSLAQGTSQEKPVAAIRQHVQAILDAIEGTKKDDATALKEMMTKVTAEADQLQTALTKPPE